MKNVKVSRKVELSLTVADWELYSKVSGVEVAVKEMNRELEAAINNSADRNQAEMAGYAVLHKYREFGAADTEGCYVFLRILRTVFGEMA